HRIACARLSRWSSQSGEFLRRRCGRSCAFGGHRAVSVERWQLSHRGALSLLVHSIPCRRAMRKHALRRGSALHTARALLALAGPALIATASAQAAEQKLTIAGMEVHVWSNEAAHAQPVIVFSHGFHGCATQSRFLMEAFSKAGYIVFAPNHRDAVCRGGGTA